MAGLGARSDRPRLALRLAGAAAAYAEVNQTYFPDPLRRRLEEWLAPVVRHYASRRRSISPRGAG
jgi:hypothetical protein